MPRGRREQRALGLYNAPVLNRLADLAVDLSARPAAPLDLVTPSGVEALADLLRECHTAVSAGSAGSLG
eukprot:14613183-Alexandrium_andersonii.AAC.1